MLLHEHAEASKQMGIYATSGVGSLLPNTFYILQQAPSLGPTYTDRCTFVNTQAQFIYNCCIRIISV